MRKTNSGGFTIFCMLMMVIAFYLFLRLLAIGDMDGFIAMITLIIFLIILICIM